tara:strand:- start:297 stop:1433 length:1137 start_codon:yes stop_codon:yes gene_type:complete
MADILARNPDLVKIINKAVKRIGENHALARDNKGVTMTHEDIQKERNETTEVIEESLKAAADEMAEKMVLENTIDKMVKETIQGHTPVGNTLKSVGAGFVDKQGGSDTLTKFNKRQEVGEQDVMPDVVWVRIESEDCKCEESKDPEDGTNTWKTEKLCMSNCAEKNVNETTKNTITKLVNKKLKDKLAEANLSPGKTIPGYDAYEKSVKKSKKETDAYHKETKKKFKDYDSFEGNESPEFPHQENSKTNADGQFQYYRNDDDSQEFIDDFAHPGLIDFDINNLNLDTLTKYLEGSSETGNAQEDKDGQALGNVVPSDLGKKMMKSAERRKEKIAKEKASMTNLKGYTPDVQKVKQVKEGVTHDMDNMKKLWSYNEKTQ